MHVWCQKTCHKKSLQSCVGRKQNKYLQLVHPTDLTSTEAKCFIHSKRATQQTGSTEYKRTKQKSRRLELTDHKHMVANKQTNRQKENTITNPRK